MEKSPDGPKSTPKTSRNLGGLYHGMQFAFTTIGGLALGFWLDQRFLPSPLGTLGGLFMGAIVGMYILARSMK